MQIKTALSVFGGTLALFLASCAKEDNFELKSSKISGSNEKISTKPLGSASKASADFTAQIDGSTVTFHPLSSGGTGVCYTWQFGDGTASSALKTPTHTYSSAVMTNYENTYNVTLTVSNSITGEVVSSTKTIYTFYDPSFTDHIYEYLGEDGLVRYEVSLTNSTPTGIYSSYEWHSGNGETSYTENPVFHYFQGDGDIFPYVILTNAVTGRKHYKSYHFRF